MFFDSPTYGENNRLWHMPQRVIVQKVAQCALLSHYTASSVTLTTVSVKFSRVESPSADTGQI